MKPIEYKTVNVPMAGTPHTLTATLADLGAEGWQAFHIHEMIVGAEPTLAVYASREARVGSMVAENDGLKRKLVAAYVLAAQHGVDYRSINESADVIEIGHHACPTSPIGVCAYDGDDDPSNDDCLFCHDPEERK